MALYTAGLLLVLIAAVIQQGAAIRCYQCTSKTNEACKDPMPMGNSNLSAVECNQGLAFNPKSLRDIMPSITKAFDNLGLSNIGTPTITEMICLKFNIKAGDEMVTFRQCAMAIPASDTSAPKGSGICELTKKGEKAIDGKVEFCEVCNTDACNSASYNYVKTVLILAPLFALFFKW